LWPEFKFGVSSIDLCRNRELNLIRNFSSLLQLQAAYDIAYLAVNVPGFVVPALLSEINMRPALPLMPVVMPLLHVFLTGK
jgi:hypothetical protein